MRISTITAALLLTALGCARSDRSDADTTPAASASTASPGDSVRTAASVAKAIEANPARADSILQAAGYTRESFEKLMYEIAADSVRSAAYAAARTP